MNDKELDLLEAAGNCYQTCLESFDRTMEMISRWRGYTPEEVIEILREVRERYGQDPHYIELRKRFPEEFPV